MTHLIIANHLTKAWGSNVAVKDFSLAVMEGEVVALLGGAGSGKSTILKMISADVKPDEGNVSVCGYDTVLQAGMVRPRMGIVKHERFLEPNITGRENLDEQAMLRFLAPDEAEQRVKQLLALIDIGTRIDAPAQTYTSDEWMRLEMAATLIHRPQVWLLDEPTRGCAAAGRERVWTAFRKLRPQVTSVLFATPDEHEAKLLGDRIVRLLVG